MDNSHQVSLQEILAARERRVQKRNHLHEHFPEAALIQVCINIPGPEKNNEMIQNIFFAALSSIKEKLPGIILCRTEPDLFCGPEATMTIQGNAAEIKKQMMDLEETHPLGRLWDIDVFSADRTVCSRTEQGNEGRRCYICSKPAHECARSRSHSMDEILAHIGNIYKIYMNNIKNMDS